MDLPVGDPWFVRERVDDTLTLITEPHVHPLLRCNVWHVHGRDRDLVVDTALGLAPLRHVVDRDLVRPLVAVATHTHGDHVGGLHEFAERLVHRAEAAQVGGRRRHHARRHAVLRERRRPVPGRRLRHPRPARRRRAAGRARRRHRRDPPGPGQPRARRGRRDRPRRPGVRGAAPPRPLARAASGCGRRRPAPCSRATPSTTGRCSTSSTARTSTPTSPPCAGSATCP